MVKVLDKDLEHYGNIVESFFDIYVLKYPGAGAVGGLRTALLAFLMQNLKRKLIYL